METAFLMPFNADMSNLIRHICAKLQVQNAPAAIHKAHRTGIFSVQDSNAGGALCPFMKKRPMRVGPTSTQPL
jgi:hypothetical protein